MKLNGFDIKKPQDVRLALADYKRGEPIAATVVRKAKRLELRFGD